MPSEPLLRLAIASDLHCHAAGDFGANATFLIANSLRTPSKCHPIQALIDLIRERSVRADALLCPGDLAHQASTAGLVQAWEYLRELGRELFVSHVYCTVGNHDVASRSERGDCFADLKQLHPEFPFVEADMNAHFWMRGFAIRSISADVDMVILNTAHHHHSAPEAETGTFPDALLGDLAKVLGAMPKPTLRIALLHHHPVPHTFSGQSSRDTLPNGDRILEVLASHGCQMVIHGHKHHARFGRHIVGGRHVLIIACGAFSAFLNETASNTRNLFHYLVLVRTQWSSNGGLKTKSPRSPERSRAANDK